MTPLQTMSADLLAPPLDLKPKEQTSSLPFSVRLIRLTTDIGALGAVAALIYGIAINIIGLIVLGSIFLITSLTSFYLIHQIAQLKTLEEETDTVLALNTSIAAKDLQIQQLTQQIKEITVKFSAEEKDFIQSLKRDDEQNKQLNEQLRHSADILSATQADAQKALEQTSRQLTDQILSLQQQSDKDRQTIAQLNQSLAKADQQLASLKAILADLQQQVASYKQQNGDYTRLNTQLQQQIKALTNATRAPDIDISTINAHAAKLETSVALQKAQAERTAKMTSQISSILDSLSRQLPKKPS